MKKVLIMLLSILCLCACSKQIPTNPPSKKAAFLYRDESVSYIGEHFDRNKEYYYGTGISSLKIEGGKIVEGDTDIIPVYQGEELVFLILGGEENKIVDDDEILHGFNGNKNFVILEIENDLCLFDADSMTVIDGDPSFTLDDDLSSFLKKEFGAAIPENLFGKEKAIIKMKEPKGDGIIDDKTDPDNDHIIIRFKDGNREEQIRMYEEFCKGKCETGENTSDIYIFYFDALSDADMNDLVERSKMLDYVEAASIDHENELIDPVTKTE